MYSRCLCCGLSRHAAHDQDEGKTRAREAGFDVHLTKPVEIDPLVERLSTPPPAHAS